MNSCTNTSSSNDSISTIVYVFTYFALNSSYIYILMYVCVAVIVVVILTNILGMLLFFAQTQGVALYINAFGLLHGIDDLSDVKAWDSCRNRMATFFVRISQLWHGYEISGLEHVPKPGEGGALLIFYHCACPHDFCHFWNNVYLLRQQIIYFVLDRFAFKLPFWKSKTGVVGLFDGKYEEVVRLLKEGNVVAIAPGGVREAQFSDSNYTLVWGNRTGFAKAALEAKVPVIPVFTQNGKEAFRSMQFGKQYLRKLYEKIRFPVVPFYGGYPVKEKTHVGAPIEYDSKMSPDELKKKTLNALEQLIMKHQRIPGSIWLSLLDRFSNSAKCKEL